jgi:methanogenic corrinoid protein MtbC1
METSMTEPTEGEFDLGSLNDEELTEQVHDDLYNGLKTEVEEATRIFLKRGWSAERVLNDALVEGMRIVGIDFRDGILFVPEVLLAANSMKGGMEILRPLLAETGVEPIGKIVIGTVKGDIHDIGKNLVSMMLEAPASRSSISASTTRSKSIWMRWTSISPIFSACRRC